MAKITVRVSPKGEVVIKTEGFHGQTCKNASAFIEKALGKKTSDDETAEAFDEVNESTNEELTA